MKRIVTRKEVAALAGVSEATVSRVLNGVGPMKEETKQKVLKAAERLNYHPNAIAQSFARRRSGNLGVVLPYHPKVKLFSSYFFAEVLSGIGEAVKQSGYGMQLIFRTPGEENDYGRFFQSQRIDACIILGAADHPEELASLRRLREEGKVFCLVNQHYAGEEFHEVDADYAAGSYEAVHYLISCGCRQIAFMNGSPQFSNSGDRLAGYLKAVREAGLLAGGEVSAEAVPAFLYYEGNYSRTSGYQAAKVLAERLRAHRIDAVYAANDRMAIGLMQGLREQGLTAGRDFRLVGCDDSDAARVTDPPLSSVSVPFYEMGRRAALLCLQRVGAEAADELEPSQPKRILLETQLVIRQS